MNALADDSEDGDLARARISASPDLHAPDLIDLEVLSVLRRTHRAGVLDDRRTDLALRDLVALRLTRYPALPLVPRIWELRDTIPAYGAAYVALAELLGCPLLTADRKLARTVPGVCDVEVL